MSGEWWSLVFAVVPVFAVALLFTLRDRGVEEAPVADPGPPQDRRLPAVVVNPTKVPDDLRERLTGICAELGWAEPLWIETTAEDPGTGQAKEALAAGAHVVLAAGGDGTVRSVAQALAGSGVAMGLIPAGTGNLLARTLGTPLELDAAARIALGSVERTIDVGRVQVDDDDEERVFLVMTGTGFDADVMENTPEVLKSRVGPLAYVVSGLRAMRGRRTRVTLTFDGGPPLRRRTRTVLVGNSGTLLGGLVLMPDAQLDDGLLDIINLAPKGIPGWIAVAARVITRQRKGHSRVEHWTAKTIVISADEPQTSQIDGDPIGTVRELRLRVDPDALIVRVAEEVAEPEEVADPGVEPAPGA